MKDIECIIFDLDGTLINSLPTIIAAIKATSADLGIESCSDDKIRSYIGTGVEDLLNKSLRIHADEYQKAAIIFKKHFRACARKYSQLYPGAREVLAYFKDKKKIIITNRKKEGAEYETRLFKIRDYFLDIVGGDDMLCRKPSGCPLIAMLKKHGVESKRAIIVGDMDIDVYAGKEADITTCAITHGIGNKEDILRSRPDYIITQLAELIEVIA